MAQLWVVKCGVQRAPALTEANGRFSHGSIDQEITHKYLNYLLILRGSPQLRAHNHEPRTELVGDHEAGFGGTLAILEILEDFSNHHFIVGDLDDAPVAFADFVVHLQHERLTAG